jgi:hypothetical protein
MINYLEAYFLGKIDHGIDILCICPDEAAIENTVGADIMKAVAFAG